MRDWTGMNLFRKLPLTHHITKDLTPRSSFARKASISFAFNMIALTVRLSPVLSTSAVIRPAFVGLHVCSDQPTAPPNLRPEVRRQKVKLLIPGHIPGSFCEFRNCLSHPQRLRRRQRRPQPPPLSPAQAGADLSFPGLRRLKCDTQDRPYHIERRQLRRMRHIALNEGPTHPAA